MRSPPSKRSPNRCCWRGATPTNYSPSTTPAAGIDLTVFARRPEVAATLAASGIAVAASVQRLAETVDVVCVCTFSDAQLREVAFGTDVSAGALAALRPGSVFVNHTTGSPAI